MGNGNEQGFPLSHLRMSARMPDGSWCCGLKVSRSGTFDFGAGFGAAFFSSGRSCSGFSDFDFGFGIS